jgi:hypothetical protein
MKRKGFVTSIALLTLVLVAGFVEVASVLADDARNGQLRIQKDCTGFAGNAGGHCTVTLSNFAKIPTGSRIFYDQAAGVPAGMLDSNIVLDAGGGNWAVGRCTVEFSTARGLCTLSDGTGQLAGFTARVDVSYVSGNLWAWDGTYSFNPLPPR